MKPKPNYAKLAEIDERDRLVKLELRARALLWSGHERYTLPALGEFFLEQIKAMRLS